MPAPVLIGLPPVLPRRIRALVLGSFPSAASLEAQAYYAHPQNHFWCVLEACGVIPDAAAAYRIRLAALRRQGLAIWDLYARVRREGSGDDAIHNAVANDIAALWREHGPFPVLLNGRRTREWRRHFNALPLEPVGLPSTSPRPLHWNTPASRRTAIAEWQAALRASGVVPD